MTIDEVYEKWLKTDGKFREETPPTLKAAIMIHTGQAIIDNGGFQYFFEADFPDALHKEFIQAYDLLGFTEHAEKLKYVISLFPDGEPQRNLEDRGAFLKARFDSDRDSDKNKDIHEIEVFFWKNSKKVFELIDKICEDF
jgi:Domain of unknown function (DUF4375)